MYIILWLIGAVAFMWSLAYLTMILTYRDSFRILFFKESEPHKNRKNGEKLLNSFSPMKTLGFIAGILWIFGNILFTRVNDDVLVFQGTREIEPTPKIHLSYTETLRQGLISRSKLRWHRNNSFIVSLNHQRTNDVAHFRSNDGKLTAKAVVTIPQDEQEIIRLTVLSAGMGSQNGSIPYIVEFCESERYGTIMANSAVNTTNSSGLSVTSLYISKE